MVNKFFLTIIYWKKEEKLMKRYLALFHAELHFVLSGQSVEWASIAKSLTFSIIHISVKKITVFARGGYWDD